MLQTIDVGLCVFDREFKVKVWNSFMENHSGISPADIKGQSLFAVYENLPEEWLRQKTDTVFLLGTRAFTTWEQRPWVFKFKNYRPITGVEEFMYQNVTFAPLTSIDGSIDHVCLIIYDVTDSATHRKALHQSHQDLETLSRTDRLTGLNNRGYWEECLSTEFQRLKRYGGLGSLVMFDIDHFKRVNDTYGHQAGDAAIQSVCDLLRENSRETDISGRYGGEEFAVILSETDEAGARLFCERLRKAIEKNTVVHDNVKIKFTVSLGISVFDKPLKTHAEWLVQADRALYLSKENGRNQTTIYHTK